MNHSGFKSLLNAALPHSFRYIRFERARDHDHPEGDRETAYILIAPLDAESRIDSQLAKKHKEACRVVRRRPGKEDSLGHLVHGPGGGWRFRYDVAGSAPDETGFQFDNERFEPGEYVSVHDADGSTVYRIHPPCGLGALHPARVTYIA